MLADISCEKYCSTCFISISVSVSVSMYYDSPKGQSCFLEDHVMHKQLRKCELPWFAVSCRQTLKILNLWPWWPHPTCQGGEGLRISYSFFLEYSPPKCLWGWFPVFPSHLLAQRHLLCEACTDQSDFHNKQPSASCPSLSSLTGICSLPDIVENLLIS